MAKRPEWKRRWEPLRLRVLQRDRYLCQLCLPKRFTAATEVDHVIPRSKNGTNDIENLMSVCSDCHAEKSKRESHPTYRPRAAVGLDGWPMGDGVP